MKPDRNKDQNEGFFEILREDMRALQIQKINYLTMFVYFFVSPGFMAVFLYRLSTLAYRKWGRIPAKLLWRTNALINSCYLNPKSTISPGLAMQHPVGIVIGEGVRAGRNFSVYQNVTIGLRHKQTGNSADQYPSFGDNVEIFSGAVIVGGINIGNNVRIGANAVVTKDIPSGSTAVGVPVRIIAHCDEEDGEERLASAK